MAKINEQIDTNAKRDMNQDRNLQEKISKMINSSMIKSDKHFEELNKKIASDPN